MSGALEATGFAGLGLAPDMLRAAAAAGWSVPSAIQAAALPAVLQGRDVLGCAPTGSGKTAAYLLPLLQRLLAGPGWLDERPRRLRALVLAPTRELAQQIGAASQALAPQLRCVVAVGGLSINPQMMALRGGAHLLVATPGRLLDLLDHNALRLSDLALLVLDEADRLLDLGFADELGRLLAAVPARRQTLMFSATLPPAVMALAARLQSDPLRIDVGVADVRAAPSIVQRAIVVDNARRTPLLRHLIGSQRWPQVLVFVATRYASEHVADKLRQGGLPAAALHGRLSPGRRRQLLADLASGALAVLVATDLAARGLDLRGLPVVVNHDLARSVDDHTHRIGRTGRAGMPGLAVSFIVADAPGSEAHFRHIEHQRRERVVREQWPGFEPAAPALPPPVADGSGGVKGRRPSKKDKLRAAAVR
jgi:superfamily II DNA/RNA helicase